MRTIVEIINTDKTVPYKYYGASDMATAFAVEFAIKNYTVLLRYYSDNNSQRQITNITSLKLFFLANTISKLSEVISLINTESNRIKITALVKACNNYLTLLDNGAAIKYINLSYKKVLAEQESAHQFLQAVIDYILNNITGINKDVWLYLSKEYNHLLIFNYEKIKYLFKKEFGKTLLDKIIRTDEVHDILKYPLKSVLAIIADIIKTSKNNSLLEIANRKKDELYNLVLKLDSINSGRDLIIKEQIYDEFLSFLNEIKDGRANSFSKVVKTTKEQSEKYITKNGLKTSYEIPIGEILDVWRSQEHWEIRLLSLTHDPDKRNHNGMISRLAKCEAPDSLLNHFSVNMPTDDYFTYSRQLSLQIYSSLGTGILLGILNNDKDTFEYYKLISSAISFVGQHSKSSHTETLQIDIQALIDGIETARINRINNESIALYYGTIMLACATAEKLLKILLDDIVGDNRFISNKQLVLGKMLNPTNAKNELIDVFGIDHMKHLAFFLSTSGNNQIGRELRNKMAHLSDDIEKEINFQLLAHSLWLLTDIMNTLFWYYLKNNAEKHPTKNTTT